MLFVNPTALDWADAKGESLGTKGGFSWAARNRQTLAEMLGVRAPLLSALSCGALQTFPRTPVPRGGFASCSHLGFLGHTGACWPLESPRFSCQCAPSAGRGTWERGGNAVIWQRLLATSLAPGALLLPLGKAPSCCHPWARLPACCHPCSSWRWRASHVPLERQQLLEPLAALTIEFC